MFFTLAFLSTCSHVHYIKMHHKSPKKKKKIRNNNNKREREREKPAYIIYYTVLQNLQRIGYETRTVSDTETGERERYQQEV